MRHFVLPLVLLLSAAPALALAADPGAADGLRGQARAGARSVYDAALPSMKPGAHLKTVLKHLLVPKVKSGEMTRHTARHRAKEAGRCLELRR